MNTIVVPLDGSPLAEQALPYATYVARLFDATLELVRVVPEPHPEPMIIEAIPMLAVMEHLPEEYHEPREALRQVAYTQATDYLQSQAGRFHNQGFHTTTQVCYGRADEMIVSTALEQNATMVVMATHGRGGLRRWALGSVADKVVRSSHIPVLLIRATEPPPAAWNIRRILVPLDGSELAAQVLPLARDLAARAHAELVLVQAILPLMESDSYWVPPPDDYETIRRNEAQEQLQRMAGELQAAGLKATPIVTSGYPAETILEEVAQQQVDVIVMATHGRGGLRRVALGSIADRVLHATTTPLLLVRPAAAA
jgi:nucleotide-binding universal stress UspA family protein